MTITGVNFAVKPAGTDEDISVTEDGRPLNVITGLIRKLRFPVPDAEAT